MARVYVSSTVKDLALERKAVIDWLVAADHQPVHSYRPDSETVRDSCLTDIDDCDLYVLILGHRYGFQPSDGNPDNLSITHLEYRRGKGKPCIALLRTSIPDVALSDIGHPPLFNRVQAFREEVQRDVRPAEFSDFKGLIQALSTGVQREIQKLHDILALAGPVKKPGNLPYISIGDLFKGREAALDDLSAGFGPVAKSATAPVVAQVINGMGGIGKTRLALEYAWRRADEYAALLFVGADSADSTGALQRNLAALCGQTLLDLPEQRETDEGKQRDAVVAWLQQHPGWLLILDNIDSEDAAAAVEALLPQLTGGHALLTSRLVNWSGGMAAMPLGVLSPEAATQFLLGRTAGKRRKQADDTAAARTLAKELGHLALALEQAGAYIAQRRLSFPGYFDEWQSQRDKVLAWYDPRLMQYPKSVAVTWQTSFELLGEPARRLLQCLAWLAPEPIPESLLKVPMPELDASESDPCAALAELESYSLITRADTSTFSVHRLVQEVTRRSQRDDPTYAALTQGLRWINAAFVGDPMDVRDWPVLNPLVPHARAVAEYAAASGIPDPTARLLNYTGLLFFVKAQYAEAEPLMHRVLAIDEVSYGTDHPDVATHLNNLAQLLKATHRLAEAEPLMRRALAIDEANYGADHPDVARDLNNLAQLLKDTHRLAEAEPLMRRALTIDEARYGVDHPRVAAHLNNLAQLLKATHRLAEAEPLMRRALAIYEASYGADHPTVATVLNNLASLLQDTNRLVEAEPLIRRALAIDELSYGADHPHVSIRLNNLASLLQDTNRLIEAEPLMRRALVVCIGSLDIEHPNSRTVAENYIGLLQAMGRTEDEIKSRFAELGVNI